MTPLFVAALAAFSLFVAGIGDLARSQRRAARLETAAEAIALAAAGGGRTATIAARYGVETFEVDIDGATVIVRVWSDDGFATATARDHRRTLRRVE